MNTDSQVHEEHEAEHDPEGEDEHPHLGDSENIAKRVLFRHPLIRRIAERLKTLRARYPIRRGTRKTTKNVRGGRYPIRGMDKLYPRNPCTYTYIHTYIHTYIRTYVRTYVHTYSYLYIYIYIERERDMYI